MPPQRGIISTLFNTSNRREFCQTYTLCGRSHPHPTFVTPCRTEPAAPRNSCETSNAPAAPPANAATLPAWTFLESTGSLRTAASPLPAAAAAPPRSKPPPLLLPPPPLLDHPGGEPAPRHRRGEGTSCREGRAAAPAPGMPSRTVSSRRAADGVALNALLPLSPPPAGPEKDEDDCRGEKSGLIGAGGPVTSNTTEARPACAEDSAAGP